MEFEKALPKLAAFCAYRERCSSEVQAKMAEWELSETLQKRLIAYLQAENYLNDERFAATYARSKFRQKQWGRIKIRLMLRQKKLTDTIIRNALNSIDGDEYWAALLELAKKKAAQLTTKSQNAPLQRPLFQFLASRGFEADLIAEALKQVLKP